MLVKGDTMKDSKFSPIAEASLRLAQRAAGELGHSYVGTEHLLLGLFREEEGMAHRLLAGAGVTDQALCAAIRAGAGGAIPGADPVQGLTPRARRVVELAVEEAQRCAERYVSTEHLLSGILREGNNMAVRALRTAGADPRQLQTLLQQKEGGRRPPARERPAVRDEAAGRTLRECSRDLTAEARQGKLDPVVGREKESRRELRIATLLSSAVLRTSLTTSFLLSSVRGGKTRRIILPSFCGFIPISDC